MSVNCPRCERSNTQDSQFCSHCGERLQSELDTTITFAGPVEVGEDVFVDLDRIGRESPVLVVVKGSSIGEIFQLGADETSIGRDTSNDIFLDDITVSRKHAQVKCDQGRMIIVDTGSLNGTYLNKERVDKAYLGHHDEIQIGKFKMIFIAASGDTHGANKD